MEKMKLIIYITAFFSMNMWGAVGKVQIDMSVVLDGKKTDSSVITFFGKEASISDVNQFGEGMEISVMPEIANSKIKTAKAIQMTFAISKIHQHIKTPLSKPKAIALLGQPVTITEKG